MGSFDQIMRRLTSQMDSMQREKEEKGKRTALDIGIIKNGYTPDERETQARQDRLDAEGRVRGDAAVASLQRNSDAFEVSKGRMSPDLFNMQNGGGAVAGGGSGGNGGARQMVNGGTEKGAITDADLLKTYSVRAKSPDDPWSDFNGKMPDFETYKATMAGAGGATPQMSGQDYFRNEAGKTRAYEKENTRPIVQSTLKDGTPEFTENSAAHYVAPSAAAPQTGQPVVASARDLVNQKAVAPVAAASSVHPGIIGQADNRRQPGQPSYNSLWPTRAAGKAVNYMKEAADATGFIANEIRSGMGLGRPASAIAAEAPKPVSSISNRVPITRTRPVFDVPIPRYAPPGATPGVMGSGKATTSYQDLTKRFSPENDKKRRQRLRSINFTTMGGQIL